LQSHHRRAAQALLPDRVRAKEADHRQRRATLGISVL
jgi:hypothetical protein